MILIHPPAGVAVAKCFLGIFRNIRMKLMLLKSEVKHGVRLFYLYKRNSARCQWLMPVILATQEAEIRKIMV
jgi:hypothetical protein